MVLEQFEENRLNMQRMKAIADDESISEKTVPKKQLSKGPAQLWTYIEETSEEKIKMNGIHWDVTPQFCLVM